MPASDESTRNSGRVDAGSPTLPAWLGKPAEVAIPEKLGRYFIEEKIGEGGMGMVFVARDEVLDRRVAVKLLRVDRAGTAGTKQLLEEAKSLARLSHPNIVPVYEAGEVDGVVYIAMELVVGRSLRALRDDPSIGWKAWIEHYAQAGEGLVAAHAAGMVHRDFKPANVLLGDDGRVRVADFGLARLLTRTDEWGRTGTSPADASEPETNIAGTPAYMSPEQREGGSVDERSDQYSFCVALWEALFGENPVRNTPLIQLIDGELNLDPRARKHVPRRVSDALAKGLARIPGDRHSGMRPLLDALSPAQRRTIPFIIGALGIGGLAVGAAITRPAPDDPCLVARTELDAVYDQERRQALVAELSAAGAALSGAGLATATTAVDDFAEQWSAARESVCRARESGSSSELRYDRQIACLDERRAELTAFLASATRGGAASARAIDAALGLRPPGPCADPGEVERDEPPSPRPEGLATRRRLREELASIRALLLLADLRTLPADLERIAEVANAAADGPMLAELELERGRYYRSRANFVEAAAALEKAFELGEQSGHAAVATDASIWLVNVVGEALDSGGEGKVWAKVAAARVRAGASVPTHTLLAQALGSFAIHFADLDVAEVELQKALTLAREYYPPEHPQIAAVLEAQGGLAFERRDLDGAEDLFTQSLTMRRTIFGEQHPQIADALLNLSGVADARGDPDEARRLLGEALQMSHATDPDISTTRGEILLRFAELEKASGQTDEARRFYERALAATKRADRSLLARIQASYAALAGQTGDYARAKTMALGALATQEQTIGPNHPTVAVTLNGLGIAYQHLGEYENAKEALRRAIRIYRAKLGPKTVRAVAALTNLALVEQEEGNFDAARSGLEETLQVEEEALGSAHPDLAYDYFYLGENELARDRPADALEFFVLAVAKNHPVPSVRGDCAFGLARSLRATGQPWRDAVESARVAYGEGEDHDAIAKLEAWVTSTVPTPKR